MWGEAWECEEGKGRCGGCKELWGEVRLEM